MYEKELWIVFQEVKFEEGRARGLAKVVKEKERRRMKIQVLFFILVMLLLQRLKEDWILEGRNKPYIPWI